MKESNVTNKERPWSEKQKLCILLLVAGSFIGLSILTDHPVNIIRGLYQIIIHPDSLITDYLVIGGIGAAFLNSGLLTLFFIYLLYQHQVPFNGATFAALFLIAGFSFLGKNILNVYFEDNVYQVQGLFKGFNALKYVHLFNRYKNIKRGEADVKFLGL